MDPFIGEIRVFGFSFAPRGWALCNGQLLPISQNPALFSILGTMYGGNGTTSFGLPDLQGSVAVSQGQGPGLSPYYPGDEGGTATVTLSSGQVPIHSHGLQVSTRPANQRQPGGELFAVGDGVGLYQVAQQPSTNFDLGMVEPTGGGLPHNNMQPYQTLNFCIALTGIFPPRTPPGHDAVLAVTHEGADVEVRSAHAEPTEPVIIFGPEEDAEPAEDSAS